MAAENSNWKSIHQDRYKKADWINKPNLFAIDAIKYFPKTGKILELGAGQGQDSRFFAEHGYTVVSTDYQQTALDLSREKLPEKLKDKLSFKLLDISKPFGFANAEFDVVYAHLSLHYFNEMVTRQIFSEIYRVLKPGGVLAFFTNSTSDPEYRTGTQIEPDYFQIEGMAKRYFSPQTAGKYAAAFETNLLDDKGETYKDSAKGIHNLVRYIGAKPRTPGA